VMFIEIYIYIYSASACKKNSSHDTLSHMVMVWICMVDWIIHGLSGIDSP